MQKIWEKVKSELKAQIPGHSYRMWIEPIEFVRNEGPAVVLSCPNFFSRKRVHDHYSGLIESQYKNLSPNVCKLVLEIPPKSDKAPRRIDSDPLRPDALPQLSLPNISVKGSGTGQLLRKDFTFDRFVVGNNNDFAYSAALSLASRQEMNQNSLFLLSRTGLGKSHLSQAIGHYILDRFPRENVYYITAEDFMNEMVQAFRTNSIERFKMKYRNQCDVLLMEDIHYLTGKERTQVELAQALDYLFNADKKIIFTSCYLPADIPKINEQLRSRLTSGLISNIESPDFRTRMKILNKKIETLGCNISPRVVEYLAGELSENVRQLEGGLLSLTAKSSLLKTPIDIRLAESVIQNIVQQKQTVTVDYIKKLVCEAFNITPSEIVSRSRKKHIVRPRQVAIYLARQYTDQPLQAIGKSFNRYHATAIHSIGVVEKKMKADESLRKQLEMIRGKLETR